MLKKSASFVLASLRGSTYSLGKRLFIQAMGGRVKTVYASPLRSLRPCWTAFLSTLRFFGGSSVLRIQAIPLASTELFCNLLG